MTRRGLLRRSAAVGLGELAHPFLSGRVFGAAVLGEDGVTVTV